VNNPVTFCTHKTKERGHVYHDGTWNAPELERMATGELLDRNGKRFGICSACRTVIRVDKPLFGGLHFCQ